LSQLNPVYALTPYLFKIKFNITPGSEVVSSLQIFDENFVYSLFFLPTGWTTEVEFPAGAIMGFFLFATASRPIRGPLPWG